MRELLRSEKTRRSPVHHAFATGRNGLLHGERCVLACVVPEAASNAGRLTVAARWQHSIAPLLSLVASRTRSARSRQTVVLLHEGEQRQEVVMQWKDGPALSCTVKVVFLRSPEFPAPWSCWVTGRWWSTGWAQFTKRYLVNTGQPTDTTVRTPDTRCRGRCTAESRLRSSSSPFAPQIQKLTPQHIGIVSLCV